MEEVEERGTRPASVEVEEEAEEVELRAVDRASGEEAEAEAAGVLRQR